MLVFFHLTAAVIAAQAAYSSEYYLRSRCQDGCLGSTPAPCTRCAVVWCVYADGILFVIFHIAMRSGGPAISLITCSPMKLCSKLRRMSLSSLMNDMTQRSCSVRTLTGMACACCCSYFVLSKVILLASRRWHQNLFLRFPFALCLGLPCCLPLSNRYRLHDDQDVVVILNIMFSTFDEITNRHNVFKVETIGPYTTTLAPYNYHHSDLTALPMICPGDAYLACTGVVSIREKYSQDLGTLH